MNASRLLLPLLFFSFAQPFPSNAQKKIEAERKSVSIAITSLNNNRINFGVQKLSESLTDAGYTVHLISQSQINPSTKKLISI